MSCIEHICRDCGKQWFDNQTGGVCTRCTSTNVAHFFDEPEENLELIDDDDMPCHDWQG